MRLPHLKKVVVTPTEATMLFTGDWNELPLVQNAAAQAKIKSALYAPGLFVVDYVIEKQTGAKILEVANNIPGVAKVFGGEGRLYVFAPVAQLDPRTLAPTLKDNGFKFVALRSHRMKTLSYETWEKGIRPERIRERLMKVPGVLRADIDPAALTVTVLMIRDTVKDLDLVTAAEDVSVTLFPGKAEEDAEELPPTPTK